MIVIDILRWLVIGALYTVSWSARHPVAGVPLGLAAYTVFALIRPQAKCPCRRRKRRRRTAACRRCQGSGVRFRRPVRLVHWGARQADLYRRQRQGGER